MARLNLSGPVRLTDYILPLACFIALWGIGAWFYPQMDDLVPVHWGLSGQPDRWGSRLEGAFVVPFIYTILLLIFVLLSRWRGGRALLASAGVTGVFMLVIQMVIGLNSVGVMVDVTRAVMLSMAGLFIALGFIVPLLPQNRFGGFRNSYTLSNEQVWESTNRLGGKMLIVAGLLIVPFAFTPPLVSVIGTFTVIIICILLIPQVHSMRHYSRITRKQ